MPNQNKSSLIFAANLSYQKYLYDKFFKPNKIELLQEVTAEIKPVTFSNTIFSQPFEDNLLIGVLSDISNIVEYRGVSESLEAQGYKLEKLKELHDGANKTHVKRVSALPGLLYLALRNHSLPEIKEYIIENKLEKFLQIPFVNLHMLIDMASDLYAKPDIKKKFQEFINLSNANLLSKDQIITNSDNKIHYFHKYTSVNLYIALSILNKEQLAHNLYSELLPQKDNNNGTISFSCNLVYQKYLYENFLIKETGFFGLRHHSQVKFNGSELAYPCNELLIVCAFEKFKTMNLEKINFIEASGYNIEKLNSLVVEDFFIKIQDHSLISKMIELFEFSKDEKAKITQLLLKALNLQYDTFWKEILERNNLIHDILSQRLINANDDEQKYKKLKDKYADKFYNLPKETSKVKLEIGQDVWCEFKAGMSSIHSTESIKELKAVKNAGSYINEVKFKLIFTSDSVELYNIALNYHLSLRNCRVILKTLYQINQILPSPNLKEMMRAVYNHVDRLNTERKQVIGHFSKMKAHKFIEDIKYNKLKQAKKTSKSQIEKTCASLHNLSNFLVKDNAAKIISAFNRKAKNDVEAEEFLPITFDKDMLENVYAADNTCINGTQNSSPINAQETNYNSGTNNNNKSTDNKADNNSDNLASSKKFSNKFKQFLIFELLSSNYSNINEFKISVEHLDFLNYIERNGQIQRYNYDIKSRQIALDSTEITDKLNKSQIMQIGYVDQALNPLNTVGFHNTIIRLEEVKSIIKVIKDFSIKAEGSASTAYTQGWIWNEENIKYSDVVNVAKGLNNHYSNVAEKLWNKHELYSYVVRCDENGDKIDEKEKAKAKYSINLVAIAAIFHNYTFLNDYRRKCDFSNSAYVQFDQPLNDLEMNIMHYAAYCGNLDLIKSVITPTNINSKDIFGWTPIFYVLASARSSQEKLEILKYLLNEKKFKIAFPANNEQNAELKNPEGLPLKANVDVFDIFGICPLAIASATLEHNQASSEIYDLINNAVENQQAYMLKHKIEAFDTLRNIGTNLHANHSDVSAEKTNLGKTKALFKNFGVYTARIAVFTARQVTKTAAYVTESVTDQFTSNVQADLSHFLKSYDHIYTMYHDKDAKEVDKLNALKNLKNNMEKIQNATPSELRKSRKFGYISQNYAIGFRPIAIATSMGNIDIIKKLVSDIVEKDANGTIIQTNRNKGTDLYNILKRNIHSSSSAGNVFGDMISPLYISFYKNFVQSVLFKHKVQIMESLENEKKKVEDDNILTPLQKTNKKGKIDVIIGFLMNIAEQNIYSEINTHILNRISETNMTLSDRMSLMNDINLGGTSASSAIENGEFGCSLLMMALLSGNLNGYTNQHKNFIKKLLDNGANMFTLCHLPEIMEVYLQIIYPEIYANLLEYNKFYKELNRTKDNERIKISPFMFASLCPNAQVIDILLNHLKSTQVRENDQFIGHCVRDISIGRGDFNKMFLPKLIANTQRSTYPNLTTELPLPMENHKDWLFTPNNLDISMNINHMSLIALLQPENAKKVMYSFRELVFSYINDLKVNIQSRDPRNNKNEQKRNKEARRHILKAFLVDPAIIARDFETLKFVSSKYIANGFVLNLSKICQRANEIKGLARNYDGFKGEFINSVIVPNKEIMNCFYLSSVDAIDDEKLHELKISFGRGDTVEPTTTMLNSIKYLALIEPNELEVKALENLLRINSQQCINLLVVHSQFIDISLYEKMAERLLEIVSNINQPGVNDFKNILYILMGNIERIDEQIREGIITYSEIHSDILDCKNVMDTKVYKAWYEYIYSNFIPNTAQEALIINIKDEEILVTIKDKLVAKHVNPLQYLLLRNKAVKVKNLLSQLQVDNPENQASIDNQRLVIKALAESQTDEHYSYNPLYIAARIADADLFNLLSKDIPTSNYMYHENLYTTIKRIDANMDIKEDVKKQWTIIRNKMIDAVVEHNQDGQISTIDSKIKRLYKYLCSHASVHENTNERIKSLVNAILMVIYQGNFSKDDIKNIVMFNIRDFEFSLNGNKRSDINTDVLTLLNQMPKIDILCDGRYIFHGDIQEIKLIDLMMLVCDSNIIRQYLGLIRHNNTQILDSEIFSGYSSLIKFLRDYATKSNLCQIPEHMHELDIKIIGDDFSEHNISYSKLMMLISDPTLHNFDDNKYYAFHLIKDLAKRFSTLAADKLAPNQEGEELDTNGFVGFCMGTHSSLSSLYKKPKFSQSNLYNASINKSLQNYFCNDVMPYITILWKSFISNYNAKFNTSYSVELPEKIHEQLKMINSEMDKVSKKYPLDKLKNGFRSQEDGKNNNNINKGKK
ncbi:MAG: hypothetical protein BGO27_02030 [Alphaproteobacteria bacterium 33-17]|nr:MAG: hypothetical protein BGO27_02030 [Alphaproteobacteria bacterium 33-17]